MDWDHASQVVYITFNFAWILWTLGVFVSQLHNFHLLENLCIKFSPRDSMAATSFDGISGFFRHQYPPPPEIDIAPGNGPSQRKFHLPTVVFQMFLAVSFWGGILFSTTWATFKTLRWHSMKSWLLHDSILISWLMKYSLFNWVVFYFIPYTNSIHNQAFWSRTSHDPPLPGWPKLPSPVEVDKVDPKVGPVEPSKGQAFRADGAPAVFEAKNNEDAHV